ncbi:YbhB/YbcL family Raf kinase inhibitor-like protein [Halorhabdus rudnickae]|uniref:YbhB/YbcL family Raf kinase inhibitor-like protein n=1 Tax=Halorhabdus rudnickae TaxID=1775544 RepID=UPI00108295EB|nr:YbhB/YbcL family Raf kinase inhibitor-like protein [Halorhabdus rudnickae]
METRRTWLRRIGLASTLGVVGCQEGTTTVPRNDLAFGSPAFEDGGSIPERYTTDGPNRSPPLMIESVPDGTETVVLIVEDPDADDFVHWLLWDVPGARREIPAGLPVSGTLPEIGGARQGTNDFGTVGYRGPAPPADDGPHTYRFTMTALESTLSVEPGARRSSVRPAMDGMRLGETTLAATYDR